MEKNLLKTLLFLFILSSVLLAFIYAGDKNLKFDESTLVVSKDENNIKPRCSWSGSVYLDSNNFCNIKSYNNIFLDSPKVTNDASNQNSITIRAINESGKIVCSEVTIAPGETVKLDRINAFEGNITFQAKCINGYYRISLI